MPDNSPSAMRHLEAERLAALDHDAPTLDELAHLAACAPCRAEREAFIALAAMAATMGADSAVTGTDEARLTRWESLAPQLRREGLLTSTTDITPLRTPAARVAMFTASASAPASRSTRTAQTPTRGMMRRCPCAGCRIAVHRCERYCASPRPSSVS